MDSVSFLVGNAPTPVSALNPLPVTSSGGGGGGAITGPLGPTTAPSAAVATTDTGTPITGATMPAGGVGVTGWLSAIWSKLSASIAVTIASLPLPTGAATAANQAVQSVGTANIATGQVSVGTSATPICAARTGAVGTGRASLTLTSAGGAQVFIGGSGVTTATGLLIGATVGSTITLNNTAAIYGIVASGSVTVTYLEEF